jgi:hypothetical protein
MRAYTVATAAFTLRMPVKWVDNLLSHHQLRGVTGGTQGHARRLSLDAIVTLAVALSLWKTLRAPIRSCLHIAESLEDGKHIAGDGIVVSVPLASIRAETVDRLSHAVETVPVPRRGRPRG